MPFDLQSVGYVGLLSFLATTTTTTTTTTTPPATTTTTTTTAPAATGPGIYSDTYSDTY